MLLHSVEHHGALTETLNIMAQNDTAQKLVLLLEGLVPPRLAVVDGGAGHHAVTFTKLASLNSEFE